jgi:hypothetical protein
VKLSGNHNEIESGPANLFGERIRIVSDKITALQREIDIEFKIHEGLEKFVKAKGIFMKNKKKSAADATVCMQLNKSAEKLEVLRNEMQKRRSQLQDIHAKESLNMITAEKESEYDNITNNGDGGIITVVSEDESTKTVTKKSIFITNDQSTREVIQSIVEKMNLSSDPGDYSLSYIDMEESKPF